MARTTTLPKPLYVAAGAGDLAVAQLRKLPVLAVELQGDLSAKAAELPAAALRIPAVARRIDVGALRELATKTVSAYSDLAVEAYDDLAARGKKLVTSIRTQAASKQLAAQIEQTARSAKATTTTVRKSAARSKASVKGTTTGVRKSAAAAKKATAAASAKIG